MKKAPNPEMTRIINRQAHMLASQSFSAIRTKLELKARALLKEGKSLDETLRAIREVGLYSDMK